MIGKPVNVREYSELVIVEFDDGLETRFFPYRHGFGYQIEGLTYFEVRTSNGTLLFKFVGRLYYAGPQPDESKVVCMADGWTQQKAAEYWELARQYITNLFKPEGFGSDKRDDRYWYHWKVLTEGGMYLRWLKEGKAELTEMKKDVRNK